MIMVSWTGVEKRFGGHVAISHVHLEVPAGQRVALVGDNGSGKTTLLRMAAGLCRPNRGSVQIGGLDVHRHPQDARKMLGYMPQQVDFPPNLTAGEVLTFFARLKQVEADHVQELAGELGLTGFLGQRVLTLSGGMAQRLALGVALLGHPPILLLDEPSAGLDRRRAADLRALLNQTAAAGCTLVITTHLQDDVDSLAQRTVVLEAGRIISDDAVPTAVRAPRPMQASHPSLRVQPLAAWMSPSAGRASGHEGWDAS